jgi:hypothetical protein
MDRVTCSGLVSLMSFDIFHIRQWREGYALSVDSARPNNAPRYRHTKADFARRVAANKKNIELAERMFTFEELIEELKRLKIPETGENV